MLEANNISYRYRNEPWLFRQVDLAVQPGEVVGIFGQSGAGKTTMAKVIAGYFEPAEGEVCVDGHSYPIDGAHPVQLIWQHPEKAVNPKWRMERSLFESGSLDEHLLNELGIKEEWLARYPSELSSGELQRFCLARALGANTNYLIADEMTTMLDAINQAQIWHIVLRLAKQRGIGVVAISHEKPLLQQVSDRIIDFDEIKEEGDKKRNNLL